MIIGQPKLSISTIASFLDISVQGVHKKLKEMGIHPPKMGNKLYLTHHLSRQLLDLSFNRKVIAGQIVKGGTGKTTSIDTIGSCANAYGARVLKLDADPQGNLTDANGVDAEQYPVLIDIIKDGVPIQDAVVNLCEGQDLIPSRIENVILDNEIVNKRLPLDKLFHNVLAPIIHNYDYIFIDCPPTMGQAVTAASLYADIVLAPLNPDKFSAKGLKILKNEIDTLNRNYTSNHIDYRVYLNKFNGKTILSDKAVVSLINDPELEGKILSTTIQYTQEIPNSTDENKNVFSSLKKSVVREDFDALARELLGITYKNSAVDKGMTPQANMVANG